MRFQKDLKSNTLYKKNSKGGTPTYKLGYRLKRRKGDLKILRDSTVSVKLGAYPRDCAKQRAPMFQNY